MNPFAVHAAAKEELEPLSFQLIVLEHVLTLMTEMRSQEYPLVSAVTSTSTSVLKQITTEEMIILEAQVKQSTTVLAELTKSRETTLTQMTELVIEISGKRAQIAQLRREIASTTGATSTVREQIAIKKAEAVVIANEITLSTEVLTGLKERRANLLTEMTVLITEIKNKQALIVQHKRDMKSAIKTEREIVNATAVPSCKITADKRSYVLGETIVFSWKSPHALNAAWQPNLSGKDTIVMPTTASTSGTHSVVATVLGNPSITLTVSNATGTASCSKKVNVTELKSASASTTTAVITKTEVATSTQVGTTTDAVAIKGGTCPFPVSWNRPFVNPVETTGGTHLSPLQTASDPSVLYEKGLYKMWFTNADSKDRVGFAHATSPDGRKWTVWKRKSGSDPIIDLVHAPEASWNAVALETVNVMKTPAGKYHMYYTEDLPPHGSHLYAIGLATSNDGTTWKRVGTQPILTAQHAWEKPMCVDGTCSIGGVLEPSVIYDADAKLYKMWYAGLGTIDGVTSFRVGYATSPDGITWTRNQKPVFVGGGSGAWDELWTSHVNVVPDPNGGYHMFYAGSSAADIREGAEMQRGSIGHAYSTDGIKWKRDPKNPILTPTSGWEAWTVGGPHAIVRNGALELFYFGNKDTTIASNINSAAAQCAKQ